MAFSVFSRMPHPLPREWMGPLNDFLTALGLVMILEGVPYFLAPGKMRLWITKMTELPDKPLRQTGFVLMLLGLLVVYMVRA